MFPLTIFIKFLASSTVLLTCLSRYLFISQSERKVKISCSSVIRSCLRVSLSVAKIGKGLKFLFNMLSYLVVRIYGYRGLTVSDEIAAILQYFHVIAWLILLRKS